VQLSTCRRWLKLWLHNLSGDMQFMDTIELAFLDDGTRAILNQLQAPLCLFALTQQRVYWANAAMLQFWHVEQLQALQTQRILKTLGLSQLTPEDFKLAASHRIILTTDAHPYPIQCTCSLLDKNKVLNQPLVLVELSSLPLIPPCPDARPSDHQAVQRRLALTEFLNEVSLSLIVQQSDIATIIQRTLAYLGHYAAADRGCVFLAAPEGWFELHCEWSRGSYHDTTAIKASLREPCRAFFHTLQQGEVLDQQHPQLSELLPRHLHKYLLETGNAFIILPMLAGGQLFGFLSLSTAHRAPPWSLDAINSFQLAGRLIANALLQQQMEQQLRCRKARLRAIFDNASVGISLSNVEGRFIDFNEHWRRLLGYQSMELGQLSVIDITHPDDVVMTQRYHERLLNGKLPNLKVEKRFIRKDHSHFWAEIWVAPLSDENSRIVGLINIIIDITERRQIELQLKSAMQQAEKAQQIAQHANQAKSEFLANMSHEIRTPMNGILGMTELLLSTPLTRQQHRYAEKIHHGGQTLLMLINDVLDFSRIEAGQLKLERTDFHLPSLINEVCALFDAVMSSKQLQLKLELDACLPEWVSGDPLRIQQIFTNLLGNAVKFTEQGEICFQLVLSAQYEDTLYLVGKVQDTGIGISPSTQAQLFQPFFQADSSSTRAYGGTGLGLVITHRLLSLMGGDIGVSSHVESGSTFWFKLPVHTAKTTHYNPDKGLKAFKSTRLPPPLLKKVNHAEILLVEDNPVNQEVACKQLQQMGCQVMVAENGEEAVEAVQAHEFDLVFMDCQMPCMDGYTATRLIRQREQHDDQAHTIIVALTANALSGDREECLAAGMDDYLSKPVTTKQLQHMLEKWLNNTFTPKAADTHTSNHNHNSATTKRDHKKIEAELLDQQLITNLQEDMGDSAINRLVDLYVKTLPNYLAEIEVALNNADSKQLSFAVHRLKGASKSLGVKQVIATCQTLEAAAHEANLNLANNLYQGLTPILEQSLQALEKIRV